MFGFSFSLAKMTAVVAVVNLSIAMPAVAETIRIGLGVDPAHGEYFVAAERGLFKKAGLDVELVRFTQGGEGVDAALTGLVNITSAADMTTMIRMARGPLKPLAIGQRSINSIKLTVSSKVQSINDIKKFGIVAGSVSEYAARAALKKFGVDATGVTFVRSGPPELPALLARGDIDGYFVWEPLASLGVQQGGKILMTSVDAGYQSHMWITANAAWYETHKDEANRLVEVLSEAAKIIAADPEAAAKDINAQTRLPVDQTATTLKMYDWSVRKFTSQDIEGYKNIATFLAENKMTDKLLDVAAAVPVDTSGTK